MNTKHAAIARTSLGFTAILMTSFCWAQQASRTTEPANDSSKTVVVDETPVRQPPTTTDANGKSIPAVAEKLVLADPDTKLYMPCRGPNDLRPDDDSKSFKLNPKAAVLSEEAAKQHGYKPSAHKVDCPKQP